LASALSRGAPTASDRDAAQVLEQVWFATIVAWASDIQPPSYVEDAVRRAVRLVEGQRCDAAIR